ncbi:MAG: hypothetical protein M1836_004450 [Candelina mexicana]|nr:MAG: hypothetical protein M1836_004450 [Candelina mexicana]
MGKKKANKGGGEGAAGGDKTPKPGGGGGQAGSKGGNPLKGGSDAELKFCGICCEDTNHTFFECPRHPDNIAKAAAKAAKAAKAAEVTERRSRNEATRAGRVEDTLETQEGAQSSSAAVGSDKAERSETSRISTIDGNLTRQMADVSTSSKASDHSDKLSRTPLPDDMKAHSKKDEIFKLKPLPPTGAPRPPAVGKVGQITEAIVNFLKVPQLPKVLYKYSISIPLIGGKEVKNRAFKRRLIEQVLVQTPFNDHDQHLATNWTSLIIATDVLPLTEGDNQDVFLSVDLRGTQTEIKLKVSYVDSLRTDELLEYGKGSTAINPENFDYTNIATALNVLIQGHVSRRNSDVTLIGTNKFYINPGSTPSHNLSGGLHARRGCFTSTRPGDGEVLLNVNTATSAFFTAQKLSSFIQECFRNKTRLFSHETTALAAMIKGLRVSLLYDPVTTTKLDPLAPGRRTTTIAGVSETPVERQRFRHAEKQKEYTVQAYFEKELELPVKWPGLPSIIIGRADPAKKQNPIYVPSEWLYIEPDQLCRGRLTSGQTQKMHEYACRPPSDNRDFIVNQGIAQLGIERPELLANYGLEIKGELISIQARLLDHPHLRYAKVELENPGKMGSWNLKGKEFRKRGKLDKLHVLHLQGRSAEEYLQAARNLVSALRKCGLGTEGEPHLQDVVYPKKGDRFRDDLVKALNNALANLQDQDDIQLLLVVLQNDDEDTYSTVKRWADSEIGIPTVCITDYKFTHHRWEDTFANLALKVNIKLNGINHTLPTTKLTELFDTSKGGQTKVNTMIVGADVTHPSRQSVDGCPSIAAVVATIDDQFATYSGSMRLQESKKEMITNLKPMMVERLKAWHKHNKYLPGSILFYRDGVSESQFTHVKNVELPQIVAGCEDAFRSIPAAEGSTSYKPAITLVVVGKRHQTRFYPPNNAKQLGRSEKDTGVVLHNNFRPGLVVDTRICSPYYFDFYLQSHAGIKGTSRSAHYWVLENGMNFTSDALQELTNNLCYNYARATRAVSYVPAAYYADRLCERGRKYLRPFLTNVPPIRGEFTSQELIARAKRDFDLWRTAQSSGENPWHKDLDDIMFWL